MKVLIVTEGFFPGKKYGGPPVSVDNFCSLMDDYECYIITHDHDLGETTRYENIISGWNERGNCKVLYLSDKEFNTVTFEKFILKVKPDIIYLQSLFQRCVPPCLFLAKKHNIKVLLAPRGELCAGAFKKKLKKFPYIAVLRIMQLFKSVYFQSTSLEETQAIKKYIGITAKRIFFLTNIPSLPKDNFEYFKKKSKVANFIFLSRIHPKKNLMQALECLKKVKGDIAFDIYGPLEDENYWKLCQSKIKTLPDNVKVNYCGIVEHAEVHKVFSRYDAFIFPTLSENFGHTIIEALLSGCPVIISDQTPWNDIEEAGAGYVCALNDLIAFESAVQKIVDSCDDSYRVNAKSYAQKCLNLNSMAENYTSAFDIMISKI